MHELSKSARLEGTRRSGCLEGRLLGAPTQRSVYTTVSYTRAAFAIRVYTPKASTGPLEKRSHQSLEQLRLSSLQDNVKEIKLDIVGIKTPIQGTWMGGGPGTYVFSSEHQRQIYLQIDHYPVLTREICLSTLQVFS